MWKAFRDQAKAPAPLRQLERKEAPKRITWSKLMEMGLLHKEPFPWLGWGVRAGYLSLWLAHIHNVSGMVSSWQIGLHCWEGGEAFVMKGKYNGKIRDYCHVRVPGLLGLTIDELGRSVCAIPTYVNGHIIIYQYKMLARIYCIMINFISKGRLPRIYIQC